MNKMINVYGMHCKSCELLIENKLSEIPGVKILEISEKGNYVNVEYIKDSDLKKINNEIKLLGYSTEQVKSSKNNLYDYTIILLLFILVGIIYMSLKDIKLFENVLKTDNLSFIVILLIGMVASVSSCLAVTGGIILGFSKYIDTSKDTTSLLKTQLNFHIGRILGFVIFGGIIGLLGGFLGSIGLLNKALLLLAGVFMIYMGLNILNIFPSITNLGISMSKSVGKRILNIKNPSFAPIIGALTFFLPCGFTQSMQVYAASSGSLLSGAMIMGTFALGTAPVLFIVGFGSSYFKDKKFYFTNKIIGIIVIYFGLFILSGFANMFNFNLSANNTKVEQHTVNLQDSKDVSIIHNGDSFVHDVVLEGAKNYKLTINPVSDGLGCKFAITFPGLDNKEYVIKKGVPIVIDINGANPGTYKAVCTSMGMSEGNIIIK